MHLRYRFLLVLVALGLTLAATAANAAKPMVTKESLAGDPIQKVLLGPAGAITTCIVGENGTPAWYVNYLLPPDDAYLTLLNPAACTGCPGGIIRLTNAHIMLNFRVACDITVQVRVVGAVGDVACYTPNQSLVICGPLTFTLSATAPGTYDFAVPMPADCCIDRPAFLEFNFVAPGIGCSTNTTQPRLVTTDVCNLCESYNIYPVGGSLITEDLCSVTGFPGNPLMYADADCCLGTPAHPSSWGSLKTLYR